MKTPEELNDLKKEIETLNRKLAELTEKELISVLGGVKESTLVNQELKECPRCGRKYLGNHTCGQFVEY